VAAGAREVTVRVDDHRVRVVRVDLADGGRLDLAREGVAHIDVEDVVEHRLVDAHVSEVARVTERAGACGCAVDGDGDLAVSDDNGRVRVGLTLRLVETLDLFGR